MANKVDIKDFYGRVIGTVVEESNGDKTIKDFYGRPDVYKRQSPARPEDLPAPPL